MDAVKFIEERRRMCKSFGNKCTSCPALKVHENELYCAVDIRSTLDDTAQVAVVEAWSAAHPHKTRQSVFLEQYPEANISEQGVLLVCPCPISASHRNALGGCATMCRGCDDCRKEYWLQEVE